MNGRRWMRSAVGLIIVGAVATAWNIDQASGAATDVQTRTFYGMDFRASNYRMAPDFVENSGGGMVPEVVVGNSLPAGNNYFEAPVDLPIGANVTAVSFYYQDCDPIIETPPQHMDFYFGSYNPSAGSFTYALPPAHGAHGTCVRATFTRSRATVATIQADSRYVLGFRFYGWDGGDGRLNRIYGARVKYTCPSTCT